MCATRFIFNTQLFVIFSNSKNILLKKQEQVKLKLKFTESKNSVTSINNDLIWLYNKKCAKMMFHCIFVCYKTNTRRSHTCATAYHCTMEETKEDRINIRSFGLSKLYMMRLGILSIKSKHTNMLVNIVRKGILYLASEERME